MFTNYVKTALLLTGLTVLLVFVGYAVGGYDGMIAFFVISLIMNFVSYWFSDTIAIKLSGSQPLSKDAAPEVYRATEELCTKMNLPMPKLYVSQNAQPNAFATGRGPQNAAVSLTKGLLTQLKPQEVKAVIAHELAHIQNRDVLIATIAAVIAGTISIISRSMLWFGSGGRDNNRSGVGDLVLIILAPIIAMIIQFAVSRSREYSADRTAAKVMGTGMPLANALVNIHNISKDIPMKVNPAFSSLYILNPLALRGINQLFSTHPSVESRVKKLKEY